VAELAAPVSTGHQLGALVLAAHHVLLLLLGGCQELSTFPEQIGEATVTLHLDISCAGLAGRGVAGKGAGVGTPRGSGDLTLSLTLLTVDASHDQVRGMPHLVAVPGTSVITTGQGPPTLPPTGCWLSHVAGPVTRLVLTQAGHGHRGLAGGAGQLRDLEHGGLLLPGPHWLAVVHHLHLHIVVAGCGADMAQATRQVLATHLLAGRAGGRVAVMLLPHRVVAVRAHTARLLAPGGLGLLLPPAGHDHLGVPAVAGQLHRGLAGVASTPVAPGEAFVVLAAQGFATQLLTWRTGTRTALLVTRMSLAVSGLLALGLAGEGPGALHLLHLGPAPAPLARHLQAGGAVATVASLIAIVTPTPK